MHISIHFSITERLYTILSIASFCSTEEGDYASEPRRPRRLADPYATFDYHDGSLYPSMSTFRSDGSSGSLSDCGGAAAGVLLDEELYDIPPEELARRGEQAPINMAHIFIKYYMHRSSFFTDTNSQSIITKISRLGRWYPNFEPVISPLICPSMWAVHYPPPPPPTRPRQISTNCL